MNKKSINFQNSIDIAIGVQHCAFKLTLKLEQSVVVVFLNDLVEINVGLQLQFQKQLLEHLY
jgi:hypothetical protein